MSTLTTQAGRAVSSQPHSGAGSSAMKTTDGVDGAATGRARIASISPRLLWALTVVALVAAVALGATKGRDWYTAQQTDRANAEAVAAARQLAVNFVTINHATVDKDTARVKAGATGGFLESYSSSVEELKKLIVQNKSVSTVERTEVALVSGDLDSAVTLVGVVAPTKNTAVPNGEKKTYRMRFELRKVNDAWKVGNLEFVG